MPVSGVDDGAGIPDGSGRGDIEPQVSDPGAVPPVDPGADSEIPPAGSPDVSGAPASTAEEPWQIVLFPEFADPGLSVAGEVVGAAVVSADPAGVKAYRRGRIMYVSGVVGALAGVPVMIGGTLMVTSCMDDLDSEPGYFLNAIVCLAVGGSVAVAGGMASVAATPFMSAGSVWMHHGLTAQGVERSGLAGQISVGMVSTGAVLLVVGGLLPQNGDILAGPGAALALGSIIPSTIQFVGDRRAARAHSIHPSAKGKTAWLQVVPQPLPGGGAIALSGGW